MTLQELYALIDGQIAPFSSAQSYDNAGLLVGEKDAALCCVLVALDITQETIDEAKKTGAQAIVSHHPVIFEALRTVTDDSLPYRLIREGIGAICAHTNLDAAGEGVNDCLARALKLTDLMPLAENPAPGEPVIGRVGRLPKALTAPQLVQRVKAALSPAGGVRYIDGGQIISRVAVCGGSGGSLYALAHRLGAQALVTADIKYDVFLSCRRLGLSALDAGHFDTEQVVLEPLCRRLTELAPEVRFVLSQTGSPVRAAL